jgi:fucose permease
MSRQNWCLLGILAFVALMMFTFGYTAGLNDARIQQFDRAFHLNGR